MEEIRYIHACTLYVYVYVYIRMVGSKRLTSQRNSLLSSPPLPSSSSCHAEERESRNMFDNLINVNRTPGGSGLE